MTSFSKIEVTLSLSKVILFASICIFSDKADVEKKIDKKILIFYFSLICKTPINVKKLKANTGDQIANTNGILSVCPRAKERSLK